MRSSRGGMRPMRPSGVDGGVEIDRLARQEQGDLKVLGCDDLCVREQAASAQRPSSALGRARPAGAPRSRHPPRFAAGRRRRHRRSTHTPSATPSPTAKRRKRRVLRRRRCSSASTASRLAFTNSDSRSVRRSGLVATRSVRGGESGASVELAGVAAAPVPGTGGIGEVAQHAQRVPVLGEPCPQARPVPDQGLMRDLDRRLASRGVMVEGEQARGSECVDDFLRNARQLGPASPPPRVLGAFAWCHQTREQPPHVLDIGDRRAQLLGTSGNRAGEPTEIGVGRQRHAASGTPFVQLGQRVLQEGQRTRGWRLRRPRASRRARVRPRRRRGSRDG